MIPKFVARSGTTLFNMSNVTTVLWGMMADVIIFGGKFYPLYLGAFFFKLCGVALFSMKKPIHKNEENEN